MSFIHGKTKNGGCGERHDTVAEARACDEGRLHSCGWLVLRKGIDFDYMEYTYETECGATAISTDKGWSCAAGHSHVYAEVRHQQGWDYAHDEEEAYVLAYYGITPVRMDGSGVSETRRPAGFVG